MAYYREIMIKQKRAVNWQLSTVHWNKIFDILEERESKVVKAMQYDNVFIVDLIIDFDQCIKRANVDTMHALYQKK